MMAVTIMAQFTHTAAIMMDCLQCAWARRPAGMLILCMLHQGGYISTNLEHLIVHKRATRKLGCDIWIHFIFIMYPFEIKLCCVVGNYIFSGVVLLTDRNQFESEFVPVVINIKR